MERTMGVDEFPEPPPPSPWGTAFDSRVPTRIYGVPMSITPPHRTAPRPKKGAHGGGGNHTPHTPSPHEANEAELVELTNILRDMPVERRNALLTIARATRGPTSSSSSAAPPNAVSSVTTPVTPPAASSAISPNTSGAAPPTFQHHQAGEVGSSSSSRSSSTSTSTSTSSTSTSTSSSSSTSTAAIQAAIRASKFNDEGKYTGGCVFLAKAPQTLTEIWEEYAPPNENDIGFRELLRLEKKFPCSGRRAKDKLSFRYGWESCHVQQLSDRRVIWNEVQYRAEQGNSTGPWAVNTMETEREQGGWAITAYINRLKKEQQQRPPGWSDRYTP